MTMSGEPSVTISDHESAADRDDEEKDHEETKRLLYVALTRARDRLYLAGTIANGKLTLQRGSIGRVLPASLTAAMALAGDHRIDRLGRRRVDARPPPRARGGRDAARLAAALRLAESAERPRANLPIDGETLTGGSRGRFALRPCLGIPYNFVGSRSLAQCH